MNLPKWAEDFLKSVTVIHGAHERRLLLAGQTVAAVRESLTAPLGIPSKVIAVVNGQAVEPSYVLKAQDTLEFIRATGDGKRASDEDMLLKLKTFCAALPPGPVADVRTLEPLLAALWHTLPSDDPSMEGYKLLGRMEAVAWDAPVLSFRIERHGETALGSSRASIDAWTVDVDTMTTTFEKGVGRRQVRPTQPRLDVTPIAAELCAAVTGGQQDDRLKWEGDSKVRVLIGKVIPERSAVKDTLAGRRKRLREELTRLLASAHWRLVRPNMYERRE